MLTTILILAFLFAMTFGYLGVLFAIVLTLRGADDEPHPFLVFIGMFLVSGGVLAYGLTKVYGVYNGTT